MTVLTRDLYGLIMILSLGSLTASLKKRIKLIREANFVFKYFRYVLVLSPFSMIIPKYFVVVTGWTMVYSTVTRLGLSNFFRGWRLKGDSSVCISCSFSFYTLHYLSNSRIDGWSLSFKFVSWCKVVHKTVSSTKTPYSGYGGIPFKEWNVYIM